MSTIEAVEFYCANNIRHSGRQCKEKDCSNPVMTYNMYRVNEAGICSMAQMKYETHCIEHYCADDSMRQEVILRKTKTNYSIE